MSFELLHKQLVEYFTQFASSTLFQNMGILITFLYSMTPSFIPRPTEILMSVLILAKPVSERFVFAMGLIFITTIGALIADILFLYGGRHLHRLTGTEKKTEMKGSHSFHKYGLPFFILTPSFSVLALGLNEAMLLYSGHHRANVKHVLFYVIIGEFIRGYVVGFIILHGMGII